MSIFEIVIIVMVLFVCFLLLRLHEKLALIHETAKDIHLFQAIQNKTTMKSLTDDDSHWDDDE